jgi:hypothetical protein
MKDEFDPAEDGRRSYEAALRAVRAQRIAEGAIEPRDPAEAVYRTMTPEAARVASTYQGTG